MTDNQQKGDKNEPVKFKDDKFVYSIIDPKEKTARIVGTNIIDSDICIPTTVTYSNQDYFVTIIGEGAFNSIKPSMITFNADTKLHTIEKNAFSDSDVQYISLPATISNLQDGWCSYTSILMHVFVPKGHKKYTNYKNDSRIVLSKSEPETENFDVLIFVSRKFRHFTIPPMVNIIGPFAFHDCCIRQVSIPASITRICEGAFLDCLNLEVVEIPEDSKLVSIGKRAFSNTLLRSLFIPAKVAVLEDGWCEKTPDLEEVNVSNDNVYFMKCNMEISYIKLNPEEEEEEEKRIESRNVIIKLLKQKIESDNIKSESDNIKSESDNIKSESDNIKCESDNIKSESDNIKSESDNTKYESVCELVFVGRETDDCFYLNDWTVSLSSFAFAGSAVSQVVLSSRVKKISEGAFFGCRDLVTVFIPENSVLETICKNAFANTSIEKLFIPATVTLLEEGWCNETFSLDFVTISPENKVYSNNGCEGSFVFSKSDNNNEHFDVIEFVMRAADSLRIPDECTTIRPYAASYALVEKVVIPSNVTRICHHAFSGCKLLKEVVFLPDSHLDTIEDFAFVDAGIEKFEVPPLVTEIRNNVFKNCKNMKQLIFTEDSHLTNMSKGAFVATHLTSITIPPSVTTLFDYWNEFMVKLEEVNILPGNKYIRKENGFIFKKTENDPNEKLIFVSRELTEVEIPSFVHEIYPFAFYLSSIEKVTITAGVVRICSHCFYDTKSLKRVDFAPNSNLQVIESHSFFGSSIKRLSIPASVKKIADRWCSNANMLCSVFVDPNNKFYANVNGSSKIVVGKKDEDADMFDILVFVSRRVKHVEIPENIVTIAGSACNNCNLRYLNIPRSVERIKTYAFSQCKWLKRVVVPNDSKLKRIENYAFAFIPLKSFFVPKDMLMINECAFLGDAALRTIEFHEECRLKETDIQKLRIAHCMMPVKQEKIF